MRSVLKGKVLLLFKFRALIIPLDILPFLLKKPTRVLSPNDLIVKPIDDLTLFFLRDLS